MRAAIAVCSALTRLFTFQTDDASGELPVHIECFVASDWVTPHYGVNVFHWLASHDASPLSRARKVGLFYSRVHCAQGSQECDKRRG